LRHRRAREGVAYFANIDARVEHCGNHLSTSTTVEVRRLSHPGFLIEVEVMAKLSAVVPGRAHQRIHARLRRAMASPDPVTEKSLFVWIPGSLAVASAPE
jgi:hypothetical protein